MDGTPWTFNNYILIFNWLEKDKDPLQALLYFINFWVQIHDLHNGLISQMMAKQFGNFIGTFLEHNVKSLGRESNSSWV